MNKKFNILILLLVMVYWVNAQQIQIDRGVRVEGLWCFPLVTDSTQYLYLSDRATLGVDEKKQPQFSFIRYVSGTENTPAATDKTISQAGGGGVLHFLVEYDTDEQKVRRANERLKELLNNDEVKLRGPIIFKEGRYALISSIINPETGNTEKSLMAMGAAPVLQGSKIALSFELDPQRSKLLLESFKTTTPDVSIIFDLSFSGIMDAYNAKVTVDWAEVQKNEKIGGGLSVYFVSAEVEKVYEELRRTSAIKLETTGEDARMQAIVDAAYTKVTDMMFRRVEPEQLPADDQNGLGSMLNGLFSNNSNRLPSVVAAAFPSVRISAIRRKMLKPVVSVSSILIAGAAQTVTIISPSISVIFIKSMATMSLISKQYHFRILISKNGMCLWVWMVPSCRSLIN